MRPSFEYGSSSIHRSRSATASSPVTKPRAHLAAKTPGALELAAVAARRIGLEGADEGTLGVFELLQRPKRLAHRVVTDAKPRLDANRFHRGLHRLLVFPEPKLGQSEIAPRKMRGGVELVGGRLRRAPRRLLRIGRAR